MCIYSDKALGTQGSPQKNRGLHLSHFYHHGHYHASTALLHVFVVSFYLLTNQFIAAFNNAWSYDELAFGLMLFSIT